jgi:hypothetical protein
MHQGVGRVAVVNVQHALVPPVGVIRWANGGI